MAAAVARACALSLLLAAAGAFPVYDVTAGTDLATNPGRGTVFTSLGRLDSTRAIQCYADYGNGGAGTCNVLSVDGSEVEILSTLVFNDNETHAMSVAPFTSAAAVVCYSDKGNTKRLMCKSLSLTGNDLSGSEPVTVNAEAEEVPTLSLASLSETTGVLCWSYVQYSEKDRAGVCNKVTLAAGSVTVGDDYFFDVARSTSQISVVSFSDVSAIVCYSAQGTGTCVALSLADAGSADFSLGNYGVFHTTAAEFYESIATVRFTSTQGAVCYADGTDTNMLACKALLVDGTDLTVGSEAEVVSEHPTAWMTATAITDSYALVCYATEEGGNVNGEEFRGMGTCNVLGLGLTGDNMTVGAGPPNEVNSNPTEHMSLVDLDAMSAVLCFSDLGAGAGHCMPLSMAPTTTTTTVTTSTSTSSTVTTSTSTTTTSTLTSSTETSTATDTSVTTETSTTSFHTTTFTETTGTTVTDGPVVDSGSTPPALLSAGTALAVALAAAGAAA